MARHRVPTAYRQPGYAGVVLVYLLLIGGLAGLVYWLVDHEERIMAGLRLEMDVATMTMRVDMPTPPAIRASMVEPLPAPPGARPEGTTQAASGSSTDGVAPTGQGATAGAPPTLLAAPDPIDTPANDTLANDTLANDTAATDPLATGPLANGPAADDPSATPPATSGSPPGLAAATDAPVALPAEDGDGTPAGESVSLADMIRQGLSRGGATATEGATSAAGEPVRRPQPPQIAEQSVGLASDATAVIEPATPTGGPEILLPESPAGIRQPEPGTGAPPATSPTAATTPGQTEAGAESQPAIRPLAPPDGASGPAAADLGDAAEAEAVEAGPDGAADAGDDLAATGADTSVPDGDVADEGEAPATTTLAEALATAAPSAGDPPPEAPTPPVSLSQLDRLAGLEDASSAAALMRPRELNAEPFMAEEGMPLVVLIVQDLGGFHAEAQSAIDLLPANVTLAFSPYARDIEPLIRRARGGGHEVLMMLPLETSSDANTDPGSQALRTDLSDEQNRLRLEAINDATARHVGLIGLGGDRFLGDISAARLLFGDLSEDGYLFVGSGASRDEGLLRQAERAGLPTAWVDVEVTAMPNAEAVAAALAELEATARETGLAVGVADPFPTFFEQIAVWAESLPERGVALAPVSSAAHISSP